MKQASNPKPLVIAHRGASGLAPENTLAAFKLAAALGTDGVEMDVQLSADGQPVVIHDTRVDRTTDGVGAVADLSRDEIALLDAGRWFDRRLLVRPRVRARVESLRRRLGNGYSGFAGERVPALEEALRLLADARLRRIYVELKGTKATKHELLVATINIVERLRMVAAVTLLSFDHALLEEAKHLSPRISAAPIFRIGTGPRMISAILALRPSEVALHFSLATRRTINDLHDRGIRVSCWTVNRRMLMRRLANAGVDSIITNFPDRLMSVIKQAEATDGDG